MNRISLIVFLCGLAVIAQGSARPCSAGPLVGDDGLKPQINFKEMAKVVELTEEQKPKFETAVELQKQELARWDEANKARIDRIRKNIEDARNEILRDDAVRQLKAARAPRNQLAVAHDNRIFSTLASAQKIAWTAHELNRHVLDEFRSLSLAEEQRQKVAAHCQKVAKTTMPMVDVAVNQPFLNGVKREVFQAVLTRDQQVEYVRSQQPLTPVKQKPSLKKSV